MVIRRRKKKVWGCTNVCTQWNLKKAWYKKISKRAIELKCACSKVKWIMIKCNLRSFKWLIDFFFHYSQICTAFASPPFSRIFWPRGSWMSHYRLLWISILVLTDSSGWIKLTNKMAGNKREAENELSNMPRKKPRASLLK